MFFPLLLVHGPIAPIHFIVGRKGDEDSVSTTSQVLPNQTSLFMVLAFIVDIFFMVKWLKAWTNRRPKPGQIQNYTTTQKSKLKDDVLTAIKTAASLFVP